MMNAIERSTVDLSDYPDLVVINLGMRANSLKGVGTMLKFLPRVRRAIKEKPDGLLLHVYWFYSPVHIGLRQYWRDFASLETWARSGAHGMWWQEFLADPGGTGFYHEAYLMGGGMEGLYIDMAAPVGFMRFAPLVPARDRLFSARTRLELEGEPAAAAPVTEEALYERAMKGAVPAKRGD